MKWLFHPLLLLIATSTESELAKQVEYLKAENQILRKRIHKRLFLKEEEKRLLVKLGLAVGKGVSALLTVVSYTSSSRCIMRQRLLLVAGSSISRSRSPSPLGTRQARRR
jgi:cell shape-determining protein MreC